MAQGYEPNPSNNWTKLYDHDYEDAVVTLPTEYSELLFVAYGNPGGNVDSGYSIVLDKQSFENMPNDTYIKTGYYSNNSDYGSYMVKKINNTTISPRRVAYCGTAVDPTYIKLSYR